MRIDLMSDFYLSKREKQLRFGDIIQGSIFLTPNITNLNSSNYYREFDIKFENPDYSVIFTPCCTLDKSNKTKSKFISITPLLTVYPEIYLNKYFSDNLTLINDKVPAEKAVPLERWERTPPNEQQKIIEKGEIYPWLDIFIYKSHDFLKPYPLISTKGKPFEPFETNYYLINFRNIHIISCDHLELEEFKILQLTIDTRIQLMNKINNYFRIADEDYL